MDLNVTFESEAKFHFINFYPPPQNSSEWEQNKKALFFIFKT